MQRAVLAIAALFLLAAANSPASAQHHRIAKRTGRESSTA
jgi:hypothetical protein